jgi:hypothetical protein
MRIHSSAATAEIVGGSQNEPATVDSGIDKFPPYPQAGCSHGSLNFCGDSAVITFGSRSHQSRVLTTLMHFGGEKSVGMLLKRVFVGRLAILLLIR